MVLEAGKSKCDASFFRDFNLLTTWQKGKWACLRQRTLGHTHSQTRAHPPLWQLPSNGIHPSCAKSSRLSHPPKALSLNVTTVKIIFQQWVQGWGGGLGGSRTEIKCCLHFCGQVEFCNEVATGLGIIKCGSYLTLNSSEMGLLGFRNTWRKTPRLK